MDKNLTTIEGFEAVRKWLYQAETDTRRWARCLSTLDEKVAAGKLYREIGRIRAQLRVLVFHFEDLAGWLAEHGEQKYCPTCQSEDDTP